MIQRWFNGNLVTNVFMLGMGLLICLPAGQRIWTYASFYSRAVSTQGQVDKAASGAGFGGCPLISYQDSAAAVHVFKSRVKTHFLMAPRQGEQIQVLFLEDDPSRAMVNSRLHYIVLPMGFLVVGVAVVSLALKNSWQEIFNGRTPPEASAFTQKRI